MGSNEKLIISGYLTVKINIGQIFLKDKINS